MSPVIQEVAVEGAASLKEGYATRVAKPDLMAEESWAGVEVGEEVAVEYRWWWSYSGAH